MKCQSCLADHQTYLDYAKVRECQWCDPKYSTAYFFSQKKEFIKAA